MFKRMLVASTLAAAVFAAQAGTVTVVTSFPKELTRIYKTAFEKANPGIKVEILNKNTIQGIAYVRELPVGQTWSTRPRLPRWAPTPSTTRKASTWARRWPATA